MALKSKIVIRRMNGQVFKGYTLDFVPGKESFHLADADDERKVTEISVKGVKAIFFVKTFAGNKAATHDPVVVNWGHGGGQRLKVTFLDGEVMFGFTTAYTPGRAGFFMVPSHEGENNERVYVLAEATRKVEVMAAPGREQGEGALGTR